MVIVKEEKYSEGYLVVRGGKIKKTYFSMHFGGQNFIKCLFSLFVEKSWKLPTFAVT